MKSPIIHLLLALAFFFLPSVAFTQRFQLEVYVKGERVVDSFILDKPVTVSARIIGPDTQESNFIYGWSEVLISWKDETLGGVDVKGITEPQLVKGPTLTFDLDPKQIEGLEEEIYLFIQPTIRISPDRQEEDLGLEGAQIRVRIPSGE